MKCLATYCLEEWSRHKTCPITPTKRGTNYEKFIFASHTLTPMLKSIPLFTTVAFSLLYNSLHASGSHRPTGIFAFVETSNKQAWQMMPLDRSAQAGIKSADLNGFSTVIEMEANRQLFGIDIVCLHMP